MQLLNNCDTKKLIKIITALIFIYRTGLKYTGDFQSLLEIDHKQAKWKAFLKLLIVNV